MSKVATNPLHFRIATQLAKTYQNMLLLQNFMKVSITRKNSAARKFWPNHKFWIFFT